MKNIILFTLVLFCTIAQAQIVDIPDANFKNALVNLDSVDIDGDGIGDVDADTNNDGEIQVSEAESVLRLIVSSKSIASLEGIQSFTNLEKLNCLNNHLTSLDITQNSNLEILWCGNNQLTNLNVSQNLILKSLAFYSNPLTNIDLSNNLNLEIISGAYCNLTTFNVSTNISLIHIEVHGNSLSNVDISQNPNITFFWCFDNQLDNLNIKNDNNISLVEFRLQNNPNLSCVQVDDIDYANLQNCDSENSWCYDDNIYFSEDCSLGSEEFNTFNFNMYPNPVHNILNIDSRFPFDKVEIYNLQGFLIKESISENINVSGLSSGIYFVKVISNGKNQTKKFIKN